MLFDIPSAEYANQVYFGPYIVTKALESDCLGTTISFGIDYVNLEKFS